MIVPPATTPEDHQHQLGLTAPQRKSSGVPSAANVVYREIAPKRRASESDSAGIFGAQSALLPSAPGISGSNATGTATPSLINGAHSTIPVLSRASVSGPSTAAETRAPRRRTTTALKKGQLSTSPSNEPDAATVADGNASTAAHPAPPPRHRHPRARAAHTLAERRRRRELNDAFLALHSLLPRAPTSMQSPAEQIPALLPLSQLQLPPPQQIGEEFLGQAGSKWDILDRACDYIDRLVMTERYMLAERDRVNTLHAQLHQMHLQQQATEQNPAPSQ